ncbi:MAG: hypothetical protein JWM33_601, partial [Caulobacteraceae bacterium]|nr:hypothetical protein [Caulobacteraceae bacterium]
LRGRGTAKRWRGRDWARRLFSESQQHRSDQKGLSGLHSPPPPPSAVPLPRERGRNLLLPLLLALLLAVPATAATPPGRPVWWKIANGATSTLWILGIPEGLLDTIPWKQDALKHRVDLADAAIMPMLQGPAVGNKCPGSGGGGPPPTRPDAVRTFPGGDAAECVPVAWRRDVTLPPYGDIYWDDPLSRRLPADLLARVEKDMPTLLGAPGPAIRHARTLDLALWLDLWNWPHDGDARLGNRPNRQAIEWVQNRHIPLTIVPANKLWMPVYASVYSGLVTPPEALQQKCLKEVLDQTESGRMPAMRLAAQQAWANGDLDHALRRTGDVHYCLMGDEKSTSAQYYLKNAAYRYYSRLDKAFDAPGQTIALVELDPLLLADGGVLDHYRRLGFQITTSDGME